MSGSSHVQFRLRVDADIVNVTVATNAHSGWYWRQVGRLANPLIPEDKAFSEGRYHKKGGEPVWYGATCEMGAWSEHERHSSVDSQYVARFMTWVHVRDISILDLTDSGVLAECAIADPQQLRSDDYSLTQEISRATFAQDSLDGILAPSAALPGHSILILRRNVLYDGTGRVTEHGRKVCRPPSQFEEIRQQISKRDEPSVLAT